MITFVTVKVLNIIMAVIIIALSVIPCADGAVNYDRSSAVVKAESAPQSNHDNDACSPFCVCSCCQGFALLQVKHAVVGNEFSSQIIQRHLPRYTSTLFSNFQNTIWQPPKIS